ncbi:D-beta-D-heptose 7-phosphate kinase/D-beta-D-heptose 1-phosphate adenosyltransferase [Rhizomicrobium palustre]|uniref:Bifunctional protein HldE n=1 Tax=Rhizomicrobium palustre TaxID=189966 RepID=A0A846MUK3_9PROT|nr:D-glycero-beta-D-manno-heptose-7-phosphate kinase [Rhizomicrobium palustre]NIK86915.1 D-beta-D-heptose 7-phosphate kinase/D-beta-D-heptose 1-phosphate adenosyltransferase [Rhizomicrobium palustre]
MLPSNDLLRGAIEAFSRCPIVVVGDVMLDRFIYGSVDRISPEAPVPVLRQSRVVTTPGGAGNVLWNIRALGGQADLVGPVGSDANGAELSHLLKLDEGLPKVSGWPTIVKTRFIAGDQQMLRVDEEKSFCHLAASREQFGDALRHALANAKILILSDYGKGFLDAEFCGMALVMAKEAGAFVIVDPKGRDYARYSGAGIITPNRKELAEASGMPVGDDAQIELAARSLIARFGFGAVLVTRSEEGMSLIPAEGTPAHLPAKAREVFDVSGAGDTVVATLALGLAAGLPPLGAVHLSNVAAGIVVEKVGTAVVHPEELLHALHDVDSTSATAKVLSTSMAADRVKKWRAQGLKVGFANGCFDLLHTGHVRLIEFARSQCDRLVMGLNSDDSVRRLKGPDRPVQGEGVRATVLASLANVDAVVAFDEDTPFELIKALEPDVLVKGADYTVDKVVGADIVLARGGRVALCDLVDGVSTTKTIGRINAQKASGRG